MRSLATHVLLVLLLVVNSCAAPSENVRSEERDSCEATRNCALARASKRVETSAPVARNHAKNRKLIGLPEQAFALEEPDRQPVCVRLWVVCHRVDTASPAQWSARAPPSS